MEAKREWFEKDYYSVLGVPADANEKQIQNYTNYNSTSLYVVLLFFIIVSSYNLRKKKILLLFFYKQYIFIFEFAIR